MDAAGCFRDRLGGGNQWRKQIWLPYRVIQYLRTGAYTVCRDCGRVTVRTPPPASTSGELHPMTSEAICVKDVSPLRMGPETRPVLSNAFLWMHMPEEPGQEEWQRSWLEVQHEVAPGRDIHYTDGHGLGEF